MKEVFVVKDENKSKAEHLLKSDEQVSRGSIIFKSVRSMELGKEGYFVILDTSKEGVKKAEELLKEIAEKTKDKDNVLKKLQEEEDAAAEGFGNILG